FAEGLIRQWYDLSSDPLKTRSLTDGLPLGPVPVIPPQSADPSGWLDELLAQSGLRPGMDVIQTLEEISPLRALIRCEQITAAADGPTVAPEPAQEWVYSVYPDGRIYVECGGTAEDADSSEQAMAFWCDTDAGFQV